MSYNQKHILIHDPETGYNSIADQYRSYHKHLDSFEKGVFVRFLPKDNKDLEIIDLGAGDGRLYKFLAPLKPSRYVACDIAQQLLKKHPSTTVEKVVCDLEDTLPFDDNSFDVATSFFVLEHIEDIDSMFGEVYRILKTAGILIIGHFIQRREFVWKKDKDQFRIKFFNHRIQDIEKSLIKNFFDLHVVPIREEGITIGHILVCRKA
ncbi:MAG TPA: class I SAM-dependent methyltransferase [Candidatus Absconditabacterales bacterium]|nr:class I SAM-dependent methyltransferase [Candidatus Absconditabacterales bacterium]